MILDDETIEALGFGPEPWSVAVEFYVARRKAPQRVGFNSQIGVMQNEAITELRVSTRNANREMRRLLSGSGRPAHWPGAYGERKKA